MNEVSRVGEVLEGYAVLVNQLAADWTPYVNTVSTAVGSGTYDADNAAADFPQLAKLVADSLIAIGSEMVDAYAILTSDFSEQSLVAGLGTDPAKAATTRILTVKGDLVSVSGQTLPISESRRCRPPSRRRTPSSISTSTATESRPGPTTASSSPRTRQEPRRRFPCTVTIG